MSTNRAYLGIAGLSLALAVASCAPLIADYSPDAYKSATSLKADTAAMIDKGTEDYNKHSTDVDALTLKMNEAREFSAGQSYNQLSTAQWDIMLSPAGNLYGGFVQRWKISGPYLATEAADKKTQIGRGFDYIICLEANKQKATKCASAGASPGVTPAKSQPKAPGAAK